MNDLFIGSAISVIGMHGELALHDPFCVAIQSRAAREHLVVGLDAESRCMVVYDRLGSAERHERCGAHEGDERRRRMFGFAAPTRMDGRGRITIASWMRGRGNVRHRALLVGMGDYFEIWDLDQVIDDGPADVKALAALHLASATNRKDDDDAIAV